MTPMIMLLRCAALASFVVLPLGCARTKRPAEAANPWLDRAREEIVAVASRPPETAAVSEMELAVALVRARGDAADRQVLGDLLGRLDERMPTTEKPALRQIAISLVEGRMRSALGDAVGARLAFDKARQGIDAMSGDRRGKAAQPDLSPSAMLAYALTMCLAEAGEYDAAARNAAEHPLLGPSHPEEYWVDLAVHFGYAGRNDLRDRAMRQAMDVLREAPSISLDEVIAAEKRGATSQERVALRLNIDRRAHGLRRLAKAQAELLLLDEAMATAESIAGSPEDRLDAFLAIAERATRAGKAPVASKALRSACGTLDVSPHADASQFCRVARCAQDCGDREVVKRAAESAQRKLPARPWVVCQPRLACLHAFVGDADAARRMLAAADEALATCEDGATKAEALLEKAAVDAALGDDRAVAEALDKSATPAGRLWASEGFDSIVRAYLAAGNTGAATKLVEARLGPADRALPYRQVVQACIRARRWDEALSVAGRIESEMDKRQVQRLRAWTAIAKAQARAGELARCAQWIAALPSDRDRAALRLAVAREILGRRDIILSRIFKEDE